MLLQWRDLGAHQHVRNVCQRHERFLHGLIAQNFDKCTAREDDDIAVGFFRVLLPLSLLLAIVLLNLTSDLFVLDLLVSAALARQVAACAITLGVLQTLIDE